MSARRAPGQPRTGRPWHALFVAVVVISTGSLTRAESVVDHAVKLAESDRANVNDNRSLSLTISPRPGHVISDEAPLLVELTVAQGTNESRPLELPRTRYRRRHAADARADAPRFDLRYRALLTGEHTLSVRMRFWVCDARSCRPVDERRAVQISIR